MCVRERDMERERDIERLFNVCIKVLPDRSRVHSSALHIRIDMVRKLFSPPILITNFHGTTHDWFSYHLDTEPVRPLPSEEGATQTVLRTFT